MIKKGVSQMVAKVLAERAYDSLKKDYHAKEHEIPAKVRKSENYKKLVRLVGERTTINDKIAKVKKEMEKAFKNTNVGTYNNVPSITYRSNIPGERDLYRQILTASHVDGIEPDKLVDHVLKKYL